MKGSIGVLVGDLKARVARRIQKDNVQVIRKETGWEETNIDMGQGRTVTIGVHSAGNFWTS
jgi:hypothetical protein